ncbi:glycosyltransferase family 4 protein [Leifsonia sp. ZF2019]|uniref:glycosyltransferase family 4 protein n=1 Tax=Leifsonia sp. ZF2019 TaxID=2781978 RepID=UPI001CBD8D55|nr:glycosyltransferase family 4 protein [Leifsonia sp. ZF2019]UAJ80557.1 glycosyltransferase family 4 protein [Leifsonia sp. ZF2019]
MPSTDRAIDAPDEPTARRRILVVTPDTLGTLMAGPAIRAWEIATALSQFADVRLISTNRAQGLTSDRFHVAFADDVRLRTHVDWADVLVFQGHVLRSFPWIKTTDTIIVADIYDPMHLEQLEQGKDLEPVDRMAVSIDTVEVLNDQLERADFMVCASDKQRDFWLGQLAGLARINPATYDADPSLRSLLDVAPFGVQNEPPVQKQHGIKGVVPGIGPDDKVIIWGGGIYNWFDPLTLIRAVAVARAAHPDLRLFFMGAAHPNPDIPAMRMAVEARALADELGLAGEAVFFNESWVPYADRADFLLDADLGVSTHYEHLETQFSFRTRILDYLWASLPIISTDGDTFAGIIRENDLGRVVPPEDVDALAAAIEELLYDAEARSRISANVAAFARSHTWEHSLRALVAFCKNPSRAPDLVAGVESERTRITNDLRRRVSGLEASSSWRLTKPLRTASHWLAQRARKL